MKNKILTALLSVLIAFGLWLYVITVVSPGSEKTVYNISVGMQGDATLADRGLCITNHPETTKVSLQLAGNRIDLNKVNNSNITITLDVSNISEPGEYDQPYTITTPGNIAANAFTIQKRTPGTIKVVVEKRITEKIPVDIQLTQPDEGYTADVDEIEAPQNIWISGPERIVKNISVAVVRIDLAGQHERLNTQMPYQLLKEDGSALTEEELNLLVDDQEENGMIPVNLRIAPKKTIASRDLVKIISDGATTESDAQITFYPAEITVSGNLQPLLEGQTALPDIDLNKLTEQTNKFTLKLNLPPNVVCESGETEIEVEVNFPDLRTTQLVISNFAVEDVPEGKDAAVNTKSLTVQFRGKKAEIEALKTGDITATVSFRDGREGQQERIVTIHVANKTVSVLGTYQVETTLTAKQTS